MRMKLKCRRCRDIFEVEHFELFYCFFKDTRHAICANCMKEFIEFCIGEKPMTLEEYAEKYRKLIQGDGQE